MHYPLPSSLWTSHTLQCLQLRIVSTQYFFRLITLFVVRVSTYQLGAKPHDNTGLSKKMDGIWNRYNLKSTGRIYTFGVLKCSEKFKVLDLP